MKLYEKNGKVHIGKYSFDEIAEKYGTPFYLYDVDTVKEKIQEVRRAFGDTISLFYAMKANPNLELLKAIKDDIDGLDISSAGEMEQAISAGYDPVTFSFAGPGKTKKELEQAVKNKIGIISVESTRELRDLREIADATGQKANICLRINPLMLTKEFAIKMGGKATQFGIDEEVAGEAITYVRQNENVFNLKGIHIYAGTQCLTEESLVGNIKNTLQIATNIYTEHGFKCYVINLGGGFGVSYYEEGRQLDLHHIADCAKEVFADYKQMVGEDVILILELGRYLVTEVGIYVARVVSEKLSRGEQFYVLDGGINHHLAASGNLGTVLRKNYLVWNLSNSIGEIKKCHLVGPLCTPLDLMGKSISIESPRLEDLIGFLNSGSYAFSASPLFFLGHETPAELLLFNDVIRVGRHRNKIIDLTW